jgi:hypothetical protein
LHAESAFHLKASTNAAQLNVVTAMMEVDGAAFVISITTRADRVAAPQRSEGR